MSISPEKSALTCNCSGDKDFDKRVNQAASMMGEAYGRAMLATIMCPKGMLLVMARVMSEGMALVPKSERDKIEEEFKLLLEMEFSKHESVW